MNIPTSINCFRLFQYQKSQIDSFYICQSLDSCLEHLKHDDNSDLAVGGSRQHILNSPSYSPSKLFCFNEQEHIVSYQPMLLMRSDFVLKSQINIIIRNAFESGLLEKWNRDSQRKKERLIPFQVPIRVNLQNYYVVVTIFGAGIIFSTVTFITERIVENRLKKTRSSPWTYLEGFFNGRRNYLTHLPEKLQRNQLTLQQFIGIDD